MRSHKTIIILVLAALLVNRTLLAQAPSLNTTLQDAYARFDGHRLVVGNSRAERSWSWTGKGFVTSSLINKETLKEWCDTEPTASADWSLPETNELSEASLVSLTAKESDDERFTASHLQVNAVVHYQTLETMVNYEVWIFPQTSGFRTQLFVKSTRSFQKFTESHGIPSSELRIVEASPAESAQTAATYAIDDNLKTFYRTSVQDNANTPANFIVLDLGREREIESVGVNQMQDYAKPGRIRQCAVYAANDPGKFDMPAIGSADLTPSDYSQFVICKPVKARYLKFVAIPTSFVNDSKYRTSLSELRIFDLQYPRNAKPELIVERFPVGTASYLRRGMGYYGDTQWRNSLDLPFYREESKAAKPENEIWDWNSLLSVETSQEGFCLVKESHKTVLQRGHYTGGFECTTNGIVTTGWGIAPEEISSEYKKCWANWCIPYQGQEDDRQLAIKQFDRKRFPNTLPGHYTVYACSWGNSFHPSPTRGARDGALERNVLSELDVSRDAGVEVYLIDDGWQVAPDITQSIPTDKVWRPHPLNYPDGWTNVVRKANENQVRLALWASVNDISPADLRHNQDQGAFIGWKFDFADITSYDTLAAIESKARSFISDYRHSLSIQFDLTENIPRYGFYWGREYGLIWLENKERTHARYDPPVVLRDAWELSKYVNSDKFQLPIRNIDSFGNAGDGMLYNVEYCNAITFMSSPKFFEKVGSYKPENLARIRRNLELYKRERDLLGDSFVFPVGDKPSNRSFTGFQAVHEDFRSGHLLLFRELFAPTASKEIRLRFLKSVNLELTNLKTGRSRTIWVDALGLATFTIDQPADFEYYRYQVNQK